MVGIGDGGKVGLDGVVVELMLCIGIEKGFDGSEGEYCVVCLVFIV